MDINLCQNKYLNLSCMGCCGHDYKSKDEVLKSIQKNTFSFKKTKDPKKWGERKKSKIRKSGVCFNLIKKRNEFFCPLHPLQNNGKELRDNVCDKNHICKTIHEFKTWNKQKQTEFLNFLKNKNLDWYSYSIGMDTDYFLKQFTYNKN